MTSRGPAGQAALNGGTYHFWAATGWPGEQEGGPEEGKPRAGPAPRPRSLQLPDNPIHRAHSPFPGSIVIVPTKQKSNANSGGDFAVVWASSNQDGDAAGIFGQRFLSSGTALGPEFRVNAYTTAGQTRASVVSSFSGNFVVVWASDVQDGSGYSIFGQRYSPIVPVELMHFRVE